MQKSNQKLIVFDLDETLIHATRNQLAIHEDFRYEDYFIYKRPGVDEFLIECQNLFNIALWSSAMDDYVHSVAKGILPSEINPVFIWGRSECWLKIAKIEDPETGWTRKEYQNIKPLEKIRRKGYKMSDLLIVDDSEYKVIDNPNNYLLINPFKGEQNDDELGKLLTFLKRIVSEDDFRKVDKGY